MIALRVCRGRGERMAFVWSRAGRVQDRDPALLWKTIKLIGRAVLKSGQDILSVDMDFYGLWH